MDLVDQCTYRWEWSEEKGSLPEQTRRAFVNIFDPTSENAQLVMRHLVGMCKWEDQMEYNDPIIEAKMNSLRGVIREIKKQLNMSPIEEPKGEGDE